jgi:hypothetical protein
MGASTQRKHGISHKLFSGGNKPVAEPMKASMVESILELAMDLHPM